MKQFRQVAISDRNIKMIKEFLRQQEKEDEVISSIISDSELDQDISSRAKSTLQYMNRKFIDGVPDIDRRKIYPRTSRASRIF